LTPSSTARQSILNAAAKRPRDRKRTRGPRLQLRSARFEDYDAIIQLEALLNPQTLSQDDWRMLWLSNPIWPKVASWWPIGWVLETPDGKIVGCMGNLPMRYHFRGEELLAASGRGWMVLPEHRAFGSARRLLDIHFDQPSVDFIMDTSVSQEASERFGFLSRKVPATDWESVAYFVTGQRAFATRALHKLKVPFAQALAPAAGAALRLKDAILGKRFARHSAFSIEEADGFDSRFDTFWTELLREQPETVLAARDSATLAWHFDMPLRTKRLWILTASRDRALRAYAIFERKDVGQELHRMRLVDYQTIEKDADLLEDLLGEALRRCLAQNICVLDKSGLGLAKMRAFDESAPYRRKQPWPFWYRVGRSGAFAAELRQPQFWEPTEYDGDASIG
jgi:hypothetical protein